MRSEKHLSNKCKSRISKRWWYCTVALEANIRECVGGSIKCYCCELTPPLIFPRALIWLLDFPLLFTCHTCYCSGNWSLVFAAIIHFSLTGRTDLISFVSRRTAASRNTSANAILLTTGLKGLRNSSVRGTESLCSASWDFSQSCPAFGKKRPSIVYRQHRVGWTVRWSVRPVPWTDTRDIWQ